MSDVKTKGIITIWKYQINSTSLLGIIGVFIGSLMNAFLDGDITAKIASVLEYLAANAGLVDQITGFDVSLWIAPLSLAIIGVLRVTKITGAPPIQKVDKVKK